MPGRIYVTGVGIVSAIGRNIQETMESLLLQKTGLGFTSRLDTIHKYDFPVGEVNMSDSEIKKSLDVKESQTFTRTALLGLYAAKEALENAGIKSGDEFKTGLISGNSVGGMDRSELFLKDFIDNHQKGRLRDIIGHDCGDSTERIAKYFNIGDYISTISTACSSSANAIMFGARLIKNNLLDRVVVGGTDALTTFTLNGFNSLMILDRKHCRPFDETRSGINLGEGAAYMVLESEMAVNRKNKEALCEVKGYGNACDAFHQTASSPAGKGAMLAMKRALQVAQLLPEDISYLNAHGTGTVNNDLSEGNAMVNVFSSHIPPFSSTKSFTGHTLGASGAIEAVLSILAIKNNCIYPNLNFATPVKELELVPVINTLENTTIKNVMSNSFGFGGNNTSLIFSAC